MDSRPRIGVRGMLSIAGMTNGGSLARSKAVRAHSRTNDEGMPRMANERLPEQSIPDRRPGTCFHSNDDTHGSAQLEWAETPWMLMEPSIPDRSPGQALIKNGPLTCCDRSTPAR